MKLAELRQFLSDCIKKQVPFPRNTMTVVVEDFYEEVPDEYQNTQNLEFRHNEGQEFAMVIIIPPTPKND